MKKELKELIEKDFEKAKECEAIRQKDYERFNELKDNPFVKEYLDLEKKYDGWFAKHPLSDKDIFRMVITEHRKDFSKESCPLYLYRGEFFYKVVDATLTLVEKGKGQSCKLYTNVLSHKDVIMTTEMGAKKFEKANIILYPTYPEDLERSDVARINYLCHLTESYVEKEIEVGEEEAVKFFKEKYGSKPVKY